MSKYKINDAFKCNGSIPDIKINKFMIVETTSDGEYTIIDELRRIHYVSDASIDGPLKAEILPVNEFTYFIHDIIGVFDDWDDKSLQLYYVLLSNGTTSLLSMDEIKDLYGAS